MKIKLIKTALLSLTAAIFAISLAGCAPSISPNTYNPYCATQANQVVKGVVSSARTVKVEGTSSIGAVSGGLTGVAAGSMLLGGNASIFTAIAGGVIGGLAGNAMERQLTARWGTEYVVKTCNGMVSVVQACNPPLQRGQHVLVLIGPQSRIIPDPDFVG